MKLLKYENYVVSPTEEAFLVRPIRELFNADKSETKEVFMRQLSYLYFMVDPRSSYADVIDLEERKNLIIAQEGLPSDFEPSATLVSAMETYRQLTTTTSMNLLNSMRVAIDKIGAFLEEVDLFAEDDKGRPKYNADRVASVADKAPQLAKKLIETEKIVAAEIEQVGRARGGNETKKLFEDGV